MIMIAIILIALSLYQQRIIKKLQNKVYELENFNPDNRIAFELNPMEY